MAKAGRFPIGHSKFPAFIAVATRHRCIDRLRAIRPTEKLDDLSILVSSAGKVEEAMDLEMITNRLEDAIRRLPIAQRQALRLAYNEGLAHTAIASRLGAPLGTIKTRISLGA